MVRINNFRSLFHNAHGAVLTMAVVKGLTEEHANIEGTPAIIPNDWGFNAMVKIIVMVNNKPVIVEENAMNIEFCSIK